MVGPVDTAGQFGGLVDDGAEKICLVDVFDALQEERNALDAHAGVDVLLRQRSEDRVVALVGALAALVLHEHEVPDLDVAILVGFGATLDAVFGATVVEDLRAGAARPGNAHGPVVVLHAAALDALFGHSYLVAPDRECFVVVEVDGGPQARGIDAVSAVLDRTCQQLPGVGDGFLLEVVTEGEVARHLEEGVVAGGDADLFDVQGADALLHGRRP